MEPSNTTPLFTLGMPQLRLGFAFVALALISTAVADAARFTFLLPGAYPRATSTLYAYRTLEEAPEVLLLGSSRIDMGFDGQRVEDVLSAELGREVSVYKFAQRGLRSSLLHSLLRDYVQPNPPSQVLLVGVGLQLFETSQSARPVKQMGRFRDYAGLLAGDVTPRQWRAYLAFPFRGLHVLANLPWMLEDDTRAMRAHMHEHSGELSPDLDSALIQIEELAIFRRRLTEGDPEPPTKTHLFHGGWFDRVVERLAQLPCEVLLVRTPVRAKFTNKVSAETWGWYYERIREVCDEHGFRFVDLDAAPYKRGEEDLRDSVHLTVEGARRLSEMVARDLLAPMF